MTIHSTCPKCGSNGAWYEFEPPDVTLRCICGMRKLIATTLEEMTIEHREPKEIFKLPKRHTRLYATLAALFAVEPSKTDRITEVLNSYSEGNKTKDVASLLTVLKYRNLVEVVEYRKGVVGGSTWKLTDRARELFTGRK